MTRRIVIACAAVGLGLLSRDGIGRFQQPHLFAPR